MKEQDRNSSAKKYAGSGFPALSRSFVPSVFTVMNMVCGYVAIVMAGAAHFHAAGWFIIIAAFFDVFDGYVARLTNGASEFGGELDSLSDLVSFGVAPAYLVYNFALSPMGAAGVMVSSLLVIGSALRLARYNVVNRESRGDSFSGLPTSAQALTVVGFVLWMLSDPLLSQARLIAVLSWMTIILSMLMVSKVNYQTFPRLNLDSLRAQPLQTGLYIAVFFCVLIFHAKAFFLAMLLYILLGVMRSLSLMVRQTVL
ncbi:MAG: CDP-diacylglycerol--serine O-phosphatidyltransferase [Prosthecochloris sp.]|uniref:CDP-diacylglycerol--serine O-phosphatidyltransferase n=1 Tax=Prosthecochloris sp. TaxID=290513 RepID=UPI0013C66776|nr:CDP-diacylglycerol--serine O-phosphatidyltransferase [Prosthecochloris sp.]NEX11819.1 CDP-diacylglycerol--serine O-phosphatidyltransferase [Prosthecochloris sp.]